MTITRLGESSYDPTHSENSAFISLGPPCRIPPPETLDTCKEASYEEIHVYRDVGDCYDRLT
jgi:hypothetical protein